MGACTPLLRTQPPGGKSQDSSVSAVGSAPLVVRAGKSLDDYVSEYDLT
ncbi:MULTISPECIES: hypothetical protein [unclassified Streptomyces]|nr:hypothetical protein OG395_49885 [Streptomyces sp. NBC_01320]